VIAAYCLQRRIVAAISNIPLDDRRRGDIAEVPLRTLPFGAARIDREGVVVAVNDLWADVLPKPGESWFAWCGAIQQHSPEVSAGLLTGVRRLLEGYDNHYAAEYDDREGRCRLTLSACPEGALVIHERLGVSRQDNGWESHKMETAGRLVGGVAHDFANLLTMISGYCDLLQSRLPESNPMRPELDEIRKAANRGSQLTSQLLAFTRGQTLQPRALDLNAVIVDLQRMLRPIIGEYVELEAVLSPGLHRIMADPGQIDQVLVNLILNARDAMPGGGRIAVQTSNTELPVDEALSHGIKAGPCVLLSVKDDGHGMDSGTLRRIFQPFFTTKEKSKGTGLGLNTVRRIVQHCGGDIWARSAPGEGAVFTICLPSAADPGEAGQPASPALRPNEGKETILLVEDDEGVRRLIGHVLHRRGYRVLEAESGESALRVFENSQVRIDLVLTDIVMRRMSGHELAERLLERRPDLKIVFMSGYTDDVLLRTGPLKPGISFLQKPLRPDVLASKLRETLDSSSKPIDPK
jgi:two-component system, cell cycle sensor histidine kinase and response regulator CckA